MSSIYQLFNQNFVSSELYYLPINSGVNKILTCKDLLGEFQWSSLSNIAVTDIKSDNSNILINNTYNTFQKGQITVSLNNDLNNLNLVVSDTFSGNRIYIDNIYEKTLNNNININNNVDCKNNNITNVNNLYNSNIYNTNSYTSNIYTNELYEKTVGNNININNNVDCKNNNITNVNNLYNTNIYNTNSYTSNIYTNELYEKTVGNNININNNVDCKNNNITNVNNLYNTNIYNSNSYTTNIYVNEIFEKTVGSNININNEIKLKTDANITVLNDNNIRIGSQNHRIKDIYSITIHSSNLYGQIIDSTQNSIISIPLGNIYGNLSGLNTNNIIPNINNTINLGSSINKFLNIFSSTNFSTTTRQTNVYTNNIYENTTGNNIQVFNNTNFNNFNITGLNFLYTSIIHTDNLNSNINNNIKINNNVTLKNSINLLIETDNSNNIGDITNRISQIHSHNIYTYALIGNLNTDINVLNNLKPNNNNTLSLGTSSFIFNSSYINNTYTNNIYEQKSNGNININNTVDCKNNNINNISSLYTRIIHSTDNTKIQFNNNLNINNNYLENVSYINFGQSNLGYYEQGQFILNQSLAYTGSIYVNYIIIGKMITLMFPSDSILRNVNFNYLEMKTIPSFMRPIYTIFQSGIYGSNNNAGRELSVAITNTGIIYVGASSSNIFEPFDAGNVICGFYAFSISYFIN
jgi:hypothetical protein